MVSASTWYRSIALSSDIHLNLSELAVSQTMVLARTLSYCLLGLFRSKQCNSAYCFSCFKIAKWEKIFYGILITLLFIMFLFNVFATIHYFAAFPVDTKTDLRRYDQFRYPYIIACKQDPVKTASDKELLVQALTTPSRVSKEVMATVEAWDDAKIDSVAATIGPVGSEIETGYAPACSALATSCKLGGKVVDCCAKGREIVTSYGICNVIDISELMEARAKPMKSLEVILSASGSDVVVGAADHHKFYLNNAVTLKDGDDVQLGIEGFQFRLLGPPFSHMEEHNEIDDEGEFKAFNRKYDDENAITNLNEMIRKKCKCNFGYGVNVTDGCSAKQSIRCASAVIASFEEGGLDKDESEYFRNGEMHYKLFSRASRAGTAGEIKMSMRFESEYHLRSEMFVVFTIAELFFRIGSGVAIHMSAFVLIFCFVQLCKCCCKCCRADEKYDGNDY